MDKLLTAHLVSNSEKCSLRAQPPSSSAAFKSDGHSFLSPGGAGAEVSELIYTKRLGNRFFQMPTDGLSTQLPGSTNFLKLNLFFWKILFICWGLLGYMLLSFSCLMFIWLTCLKHNLFSYSCSTVLMATLSNYKQNDSVWCPFSLFNFKKYD